MLSPEILSKFVLETLRLSGALASHADEMVADIGLTSARWQVIGAIQSSQLPQPVAHLARDMRLSRQGVQRIINELHKEGMVTFEKNPHHTRAYLVRLTNDGAAAFDCAIERQNNWIKTIGDELNNAALLQATSIMNEVRVILESANTSEKSSLLDKFTQQTSGNRSQ